MTWDMLLTFVGLAGIWLAGSKKKLGWAIGFGVQGLWVAYALDTDQEWFVLSAFAYATLYGRNWLRWRREERSDAGTGVGEWQRVETDPDRG